MKKAAKKKALKKRVQKTSTQTVKQHIKRVRDYDEWLLARLNHPVESVAYLQSHLDERNSSDFRELLAIALINIGRANGVRLVLEEPLVEARPVAK